MNLNSNPSSFGHEFVSSLVKFFFKKNVKYLTHRNIHFNSVFSKNIYSKYLKMTKNKNILFSEGSMNFVDKSILSTVQVFWVIIYQ